MTWHGRKVLVTGAAGFIGSNLVAALARAGAEVRAFIRYNSRNDRGLLEDLPEDVSGQVDIVWGDLTDRERVMEAVRGTDVVFHLGALIAIPYSYQAAESYVKVNVEGTLNVLEACRRYGTTRLLQTSTSEVYGTAQYTPIDELHPLHPQSPYAATKVASDQLALSYYRSFDMPVVVVRPFNNFGPGQSLRAVIPTILAQAQAGDVLRLGSTDSVRDFLFVEDTARGFMAIADAPAEAVVGETFNLATGVGHTIATVIEHAEQMAGRKLIVQTDEQRIRPANSEVWTLIGCAKRAEERFGWRPQTTLQQGLEATWNWLLTRKDRIRAKQYTL